MSWMYLNRPRLVLALFIVLVFSATAGVFYFTRPLTPPSESMDKELLNAVKQTVSPSDIQTVLHMQEISDSVVNLQLFTTCHETSTCSVHTALGFAQTGAYSSQDKLLIHVEIEAEADNGDAVFGDSRCAAAWRAKDSTWTIQVSNTKNANAHFALSGDFDELDQVPAFEGRDSVLNIIWSIRRGIVKTIGDGRWSSNQRRVTCG